MKNTFSVEIISATRKKLRGQIYCLSLLSTPRVLHCPRSGPQNGVVFPRPDVRPGEGVGAAGPPGPARRRAPGQVPVPRDDDLHMAKPAAA